MRALISDSQRGYKATSTRLSEGLIRISGAQRPLYTRFLNGPVKIPDGFIRLSEGLSVSQRALSDFILLYGVNIYFSKLIKYPGKIGYYK